MKPIRIDLDDVPIFSSDDVYDYGLPELYGYETYRVEESRSLNLSTDFKFLQSRDWYTIHRYNRDARFKTTLLTLLGERSNIPAHVISMVKSFLKPDSKTIWNDTRAILKHFKQQKYYDHIPAIIKSILKIRLFKPLTGDEIESILFDFKAFVTRFNKSKHLYNRKYFPNIRFIVFKLLELHSIHPSYPIPFVRTVRKNKLLNTLWNSLLKNQNE
jgi:hypothetical protein